MKVNITVSILVVVHVIICVVYDIDVLYVLYLNNLKSKTITT